MGIIWRLFAPRGLKKARRALHPSWVIEDAIVKGVRGKRRRKSRSRASTRSSIPTYTASLKVTPDTGEDPYEVPCGHAHRSPVRAQECGTKMARAWKRNHPEDTVHV